MAIGKTKIFKPDFDRSDFEIANHYFGITKIPCKIKAPYRIEATPSFAFIVWMESLSSIWILEPMNMDL